MRTKIKIVSILALLFGFTACSEEDNNVVATVGDKAVIVSPEEGSSLTLSPLNSANPALTVVWNHAKYSVATEVNYKIEVAKGGTDFATPIAAGTTTKRQITWSVSDLNGVCEQAGLTPFVAGNLDIRIKSSLGVGGAAEVISDKITISITPYTTQLPKLFLIGSFLNASGYGADWTTAPTLPYIAASAYGATDFEGYVYFANAASQYKFLPQNTSFNDDYGDVGATDGSYSGAIEQTGEVNCGLPSSTGAGYYLVKANTAPTSLEYTMMKQDWRIIGFARTGDGSGWNNDTNMTYNPTTKKWSAVLNLFPGNFKFRANGDWGNSLNNFGLNSNNKLAYNAGDIPFAGPAGVYKVTLDLSNPRDYTYSIVPN